MQDGVSWVLLILIGVFFGIGFWVFLVQRTFFFKFWKPYCRTLVEIYVLTVSTWHLFCLNLRSICLEDVCCAAWMPLSTICNGQHLHERIGAILFWGGRCALPSASPQPPPAFVILIQVWKLVNTLLHTHTHIYLYFVYIRVILFNFVYTHVTMIIFMYMLYPYMLLKQILNGAEANPTETFNECQI